MQVVITILAAIAIVAGTVFAIIARTRKRNGGDGEDYLDRPLCNPKPFIGLTIAGLAVMLLVNSIAIVPTGYTGVKTAFGQISQDGMPQGLNFKMPFVQSVHLVNNKRQRKVYSGKIWGETTEKVQVFGENIYYVYQIAPERSAWLKANIAGDTDDLITGIDLSTALKAAMGTFPAATVTKRELIEPLAAENLNELLATKYGKGTVNVIMIEIDQMDFEDSYNQALAEKAIAAKKQEEQAIKNQTDIEKAEADKKIAIAAAEGEAEANRIRAKANAEARLIQVEAETKANQMINESTTDTVLRNKFYNVWNGQLPSVMGEGTVITSITP